jgi:AcrR family transcriptional regulator
MNEVPKELARSRPGAKPGRPPAGRELVVRAELLAAARQLFAQQGYAAVSTRAVADIAGVNPAMIHYYFGSKQGLYEAMLTDTLSPLVERLGVILAAADDPAAIRNFLKLYVHTLGANPWMPQLILREVIQEGGRLRGWFIQQLASKGGGRLTQLIEREQAAGRIRADADPSLTALSLVSMAVFPFVAMPVTREVFGMRVKQGYLERLVTHTERIFFQGTAP